MTQTVCEIWTQILMIVLLYIFGTDNFWQMTMTLPGCLVKIAQETRRRGKIPILRNTNYEDKKIWKIECSLKTELLRETQKLSDI